MALTIEKVPQGDTLTITLSGRLDTTTAPQLENELKTALNDVKALTFNMADLAYVSSAGLRVLLKAQKAMNKQGTMTIKNAGQEILEIFEVTGFDEILNIEK
ncbi:MAG: STAS domain-containing protein [Synergistaceae bacterium]|nr:STAS domain-containing protein [Synergistaceae bacterium]